MSGPLQEQKGGREGGEVHRHLARKGKPRENFHLLGYLGRQLKLAGMRSVGTPPSSSEPIGRASSPMDERPARLGDEVLRCIRESGGRTCADERKVM